MQPFIEPLRTALILFPILSFILVTPYMLFQYRKHGAISIYRTLIIFAFIYYLMNAYFLVILPLPPKETVTNTYRDMMQIRPFQFIFDLSKESVFRITDPHTYLPALTQPVFTQLVFNVLLTIPFGFFMRYYFKKDKKTTVFYTFCLSLFFELSQLSGLFFIYPGPYRLFDADDLILNTLGGLIGYFSVGFVKSFLPSRDDIDLYSNLKAKQVSLVKRVFAFTLDITILKFAQNIILFVINKNSTIMFDLITFIIYFALIAFLLSGQTIAQKFLNVQIVSKHQQKISFSNLLKRSLLIYVLIYNSLSLINLVSDLMLLTESRLFAFIYIGLLIVWFIWILIYCIFIIIKKPQQLFYDRLSDTLLISTFNVS